MTLLGDLEENIARLGDTAAKLLRETERLRRDVVTLAGRIEPYENEPKQPAASLRAAPKQWTAKAALDVIANARALIIACERDISAIRSRIDSIAEDVHARDELKPWLRKRRD